MQNAEFSHKTQQISLELPGIGTDTEKFIYGTGHSTLRANY